VLDPLIWLLAVESLGLLTFPLAFVLFNRLPDRGYTFAKPLALVLMSYLLWVLGLTHLLPNSRWTILGILLLMALASAWVLRRYYQSIRRFIRSQWMTVLMAELVFLTFFGFWVAVVSEVPAINHTEKPMDFGFLNAVVQSRYFPPEDPWLSGHPISYYYFGRIRADVQPGETFRRLPKGGSEVRANSPGLADYDGQPGGSIGAGPRPGLG
jgi:uncharacterized membrane protein